MGDYYDYEECMKILVSYKITMYITFNAINYSNETKKETNSFNNICTKDINCIFVSLPVIDYKPPEKDILYQFWEHLDNFYKLKNINKRYNVLMHCTAGHGRTGFMIISYIWLKKLLKDKTFSPYYTIDGENIWSMSKIVNESNYYKIKKTKIMIFLQEEIKKYSYDSYDEVFNDNYRYKLFISRINVFCLTLHKYHKNKVIAQKYLKYKNKYLQLKLKLNL